MTTVISDNKSQRRNYIDSVTETSNGTTFHLDTHNFSYNKIIDCKGLPFDLAEQALSQHRTGRLKIKLGEEGKQEVLIVDSYEPAGGDKTKIHFKQTSNTLTEGSENVFDLPIEAVDLMSVNQSWNMTHPKYGKAINLSTEDHVKTIRQDYEAGKLQHFSDHFGTPLNITPEGVEVILEQANKDTTKSILSEVLSSSGLAKYFGQNVQSDEKEHTPSIETPINPSLVPDLIAQKQANDLENEQIIH